MSTTPHNEPRSRVGPGVQLLVGVELAVSFLQAVLFDLRPALALRTGDLATGWWRLATYPLVHANAGVLAVTVATLLLYGPALEREWGARGLGWFALWCALGGALFAVVAAPGSVLTGGTAIALGLVYAARRRPSAASELARWATGPSASARAVALSLAALGLLWGALDGSDGGAVQWTQLAHVGGIAFAALFVRAPQESGVDRLQPQIAQVPDLPDAPPRAIPKSQPRVRERLDEVDEIVARSRAITTQQVPPPRARRRAEAPQREPAPGELDRVLDKISALGLGSLTVAERELLDAHARRLRGPGGG